MPRIVTVYSGSSPAHFLIIFISAPFQARHEVEWVPDFELKLNTP